MFYIIFGILLCSLIVSICSQNKEEEKWLWIKVLLIYLCYFISFNIFLIKIPVLIIVVYFIIKKRSKLNQKIKLLALAFSLILYITVNYIVPQVSLQQIYNLTKQTAIENRFDNINYTGYYSEDSKIQEELRRYGNDEQIMFSTWVYDLNDIAIKDYEWLWMYSYKELDVYWSVTYNQEKGYSEAYLRFNKTGEEYLGIFKKDKNGNNYLEYVIEGKLK